MMARGAKVAAFARKGRKILVTAIYLTRAKPKCRSLHSRLIENQPLDDIIATIFPV
jgi:hypothetical protein